MVDVGCPAQFNISAKRAEMDGDGAAKRAEMDGDGARDHDDGAIRAS